MPIAEPSGALFERAQDAYDAMAARHLRRRPAGATDPRLIASRRQLLVARSRAEEWIVPVATVVAVDRLIAGIESIESVEVESDALDRFCLDVLDAMERRSTGRRDRDREAETIAFAFA